MGVSSCDNIAGEGVGLHNGWCSETMDFVDFLLCCIQNCVAKAPVPVQSTAVAFIVLALGGYWLLQGTLWKKVTMCSMQPVHEMPVVIKIIAPLLYGDNNLLIIIGSAWLLVLTTLKDSSNKGTSMQSGSSSIQWYTVCRDHTLQ